MAALPGLLLHGTGDQESDREAVAAAEARYRQAQDYADMLRWDMRDRRAAIKPLWKTVAVLVALFSGDWTMPQLYLRGKAWKWMDCVGDPSLDFDSDTMEEWMQRPDVKAKVLQGVADRNDKCRFQAEQFLFHSLLASYIHRQNQKGLTVPFSMMLTYYVKLWTIYGCSTLAQSHLKELLEGKPHVRKNWARAFRFQWPAQYGPLELGKDLSEATIVRRARPFVSSYSCVRSD